MPVALLVACYLAGAVALVSVGMTGWSMLTAPVEKMRAEGERPKLMRKADGQALENRPADTPMSNGAVLPNGAFRYGPEVKHGRADMAVNHREQALQQARSGAAASAWASAPAKPYRERTHRPPRIDPGTRPSGH